MNDIVKTLKTARMLPESLSEDDFERHFFSWCGSTNVVWRRDILPPLRTVWKSTNGVLSEELKALATFLECNATEYSALSIFAVQNELGSFLGPRLFWWPRGVPSGRFSAIVSSRLGRSLDEQVKWLQLVRAASRRVEANGILCVDSSTWAGPIIERAGELFSAAVLRCDTSGENRLDLGYNI